MTETLSFREAAAFPDLSRVAVAFAFELSAGRRARSAFRISEVYRALDRMDSGAPSAARCLFDASQSFLDDITTGIPGTNGRPLLFAASAQANDAPPRKVGLQRPEKWRYAFENTDVELACRTRDTPLRLQDSFCAFESGLLYYIAILTHDAATSSGLDEYDLIRLQGCSINPDMAATTQLCGFTWNNGTGSLIDLANSRLHSLSGNADSTVNGVRDVLRPFGMISADAKFGELTPEALKSAMVFVEDQALFETARHIEKYYQLEPDAQIGHPDWLADLAKAWHKREVANATESPPAHRFDQAGIAGEGIEHPRQLLALAGIAQGIPDFPRQDESEIHDSTRPIYSALESLFYVHPAFQLEIGVNWRSFQQSQGDIGACPYALLAWIVAVHDEHIVSEMEVRIEQMLFGRIKPSTPINQIGLAVPLEGLATVLASLRRWLAPHNSYIDDILRQRFDIFRWCTIHQSGNIFRYQTERDLLASIRGARGSQQRFDEAHLHLDRLESIVEDMADLANSYSTRRTNWLLASLALISLVTLPKGLEELTKIWTGSGGYLIAALGFVLLATVAYNLRYRRGARADD